MQIDNSAPAIGLLLVFNYSNLVFVLSDCDWLSGVDLIVEYRSRSHAERAARELNGFCSMLFIFI